jgi:enamine deaminase RidA (YjgF/YER057c/UK114 family)
MPEVINPPELAKPVGFAHAVKATGTMVFLGGQVAFDANGVVLHHGDIVGQFRQTLVNLQVAIRASGGEMTNITRLNIYVTDKHIYKAHLRELGKIYQEFFGKYYPAMSLVQVAALFEDEAMIEIEGIAVV